MRLVFMGTPEFAVPTLAALVAAGHDVAGVLTQPPRPQGRGHQLQPTPVDAFARSQGLPVFHPLSLKTLAARDLLMGFDAELAIVVAYGLILPPRILAVPPLGCINLHGSLLPRWRGAAPIQRAIMAGDAATGVEVMQMEAGLDTGPVYLSEQIPLGPADTAGSVTARLATLGADLMVRAVAAMGRGSITPVPQAADGATYAQKLTAADQRIDWAAPAHVIDAQVRGLSPHPGAFTTAAFAGAPERVRILFTQLTARRTTLAAGTVLPPEPGAPETIDVAAGDGAVVRLRTLQRAGRGVQDAAAFRRGAPQLDGLTFG